MLDLRKKLSSTLILYALVIGPIIVGAIVGWIWGYYQNIQEIEWFNNRSPEELFCGTYNFTTPEVGAVMGIILGLIIGIIANVLFQVFAPRETAWWPFEETEI